MDEQRRIIAIGGVPCSGKTTLILDFISRLNFVPKRVYPLVDVMHDETNNIYILGKYDVNSDEVFQGTDRLSMACQPKVMEWINTIETGTIIFEGDRLFNKKMLTFLAEETEKRGDYFRILVLRLDETDLAERHTNRNDDQPEKFLRSRNTKVNNILRDLTLRDHLIEAWNKDEESQERIISYLLTATGWPAQNSLPKVEKTFEVIQKATFTALDI